MKKMIVLFAVLFVTGLTVNAQVNIAYWNFNSGNTGTAGNQWPGTTNSTSGSGTLTHDFSSTDAFGGDAGNALNGDAAGSSFSVASNANNGHSFILSVSTVGYSDIKLSYTTRGTTSGFKTHDIWNGYLFV